MRLQLRRRVLIVDVETTGLDPVRHACIEVGAVLLKEDLTILEEFSSLVAPWEGAEVSDDALGVSKISLQELGQARDIAEVIREFHECFCSDNSTPLLAGWNVWFDAAFLRKGYQRAGFVWPFSHRMLDVQSIVLFFARLHAISQEQVIESYLGEKQRHRALNDARHTAQVFRIFAEKYLPAI